MNDDGHNRFWINLAENEKWSFQQTQRHSLDQQILDRTQTEEEEVKMKKRKKMTNKDNVCRCLMWHRWRSCKV